jgi:hypothetical protein
MPPLLRTVPRPRCCRGSTDAAVPQQKVVATVDTVAAVMHDLNKEMLR